MQGGGSSSESCLYAEAEYIFLQICPNHKRLFGNSVFFCNGLVLLTATATQSQILRQGYCEKSRRILRRLNLFKLVNTFACELVHRIACLSQNMTFVLIKVACCPSFKYIQPTLTDYKILSISTTNHWLSSQTFSLKPKLEMGLVLCWKSGRKSCQKSSDNPKVKGKQESQKSPRSKLSEIGLSLLPLSLSLHLSLPFVNDRQLLLHFPLCESHLPFPRL